MRCNLVTFQLINWAYTKLLLSKTKLNRFALWLQEYLRWNITCCLIKIYWWQKITRQKIFAHCSTSCYPPVWWGIVLGKDSSVLTFNRCALDYIYIHLEHHMLAGSYIEFLFRSTYSLERFRFCYYPYISSKTRLKL